MEEVRKGKGGIRQGLVCIKTEYYTSREKPREDGKPSRNPYYVKRDNWVLPKTALERVKNSELVEGEKVTINHSKMEDKGIAIPSPADPKRLHQHEYSKKPHVASFKHDSIKANTASSKEIEDYWKLFHNEDLDFIDNRLHSHPPNRTMHPVSQLHTSENAQVEHRNEKLKFERIIGGYGKTRSWVDDPKLAVTPVKLRFKGEIAEGLKYQKKKIIAYVFEWKGHTFVYTEKSGYKDFSGKRPDVDALEYLKTVFEPKALKKSLDEIKQNIIDKIEKLSKLDDPDAKINGDLILNKFTSGEDEVKLIGVSGKYVILLNNTTLISTSDFDRAIARYYSAIASMIKAKENDKDMALETFGEKVLQINRAVRPLIEKLGDIKAAMFLFDFDYMQLDWPFKEEMVIKAEIPRTMAIGMVPAGEEMGAGANATGDKPSKEADKTMSPEDKKKTSQYPIEEEGNKNISPVSIMH